MTKPVEKVYDVKGFLEEHDIQHVNATSGELIVLTCPICGSNKKKFYINSQTGLFDCKICGGRGNFFRFKSLFGVVEGAARVDSLSNAKPLDDELVNSMHSALLKNYGAIEYLRSRGFSDAVINTYKLGYMSDSDGEWIAIPHIQGGKVWNVKYRRFTGGEKTFKRVPGQPTVLFNVDGISYKKKNIILVESETDCMAARQMGIRNVVALTGGAQSFLPEWKLFFAKFELVYVVLNSDKAGQIGAKKVAEKIGIKKVKNLVLPTKDVNEYMVSPEYGASNFKMEFNRAMRIEVNNVSSAEDITSDWDTWFQGEDGQFTGIRTGFERLDSLIKGFKAGDLVIFSGHSGIGKTTCMNTWVMNSLKNEHPSFGFYLEGQIPYMFSRMVGADLGLEYFKIPQDAERYAKIKENMSKLPLYFYSGPQGGLDIKYLNEFIPAIVEAYGVQLIVIDNLQKLVRGSENNYTQKISEVVSTLKDLAVDNKIPIVLIAHIRNVESENTIVTKYHAKSSSTIYQDADIYLILQKIKSEMYLTVEKNRMGQDGVHIPLDVDYKLGIFKEKPDTPKPENPVIEQRKEDNMEIGF